MKARIALFILVLGFAASACSSYQTCATYANQKPVAPATEQAPM